MGTLTSRALFMGVMLAVRAFGQETDIVSYQSDSPVIVPHDALQIESWSQYERDAATAETTNISFNASMIRYGFHQRVELRAIFEYAGTFVTQNEQRTFTKSGPTPLSAGLKVNLLRERSLLPEVGVIAHVRINPFSNEFNPSGNKGTLRVVFLHRIPKKLFIGYNVGVDWNGETNPPVYYFTLSSSYQVFKNLWAFGEVYGFHSARNPQDFRFGGGLAYDFSSRFQLCVSSGPGLCDSAPDYFVAAGLIARIS